MRNLILFLLLVGPCGELAAHSPVEITRPAEASGAVRVDIKHGRIRIVGTQAEQVRVTGEVGDALQGVSVGRDAGALEVRVQLPLLSRLTFWRQAAPTHELDLVIEIPRDTRLFVVSRDAEISIEGVRGPIGVGVVSSDVVVRGNPARLHLEAVTGSLDFEGSTQMLQASTLSGDLRAVGVEGVVQLEAATGALEVLDARIRRATLTTVSGDVQVRGAVDRGGLLSIETQSGAVTLECCGPDGAELDLETRDGEIINEAGEEQPLRDERGRRILKSVVDAGGATARVRSRSGLIRLMPASENPE